MTSPRPRARYLVVALFVVVAALLAASIGTRVSARGNVGAPVKAGATNHTVSVSGHGETTAAPDMATITLGVDTRGADAQSALSSNSTKMNAVIASLKAQGVPANKIQTSNLSIYFDSEHSVYVVQHSVTARVDAVNNVGDVLDAAVAAGANNSWGVTFGLKDESQARSQALQAAVADARKRADAMAAGLGLSITGVGSASEGSVNQPGPIAYSAGVKAGAVDSTSVQPGELTVSADVGVVYTFG
jgi:uncharacterized protein YggE